MVWEVSDGEDGMGKVYLFRGFQAGIPIPKTGLLFLLTVLPPRPKKGLLQAR